MLSLAAYFSNATVLANGVSMGEMGRSAIGSASAWSGVSSLVAWPDYRRTNNAAQADIFAARLDGTSVVLDPLGLALGVASGLQDAPSMAFGSGVWLVAWRLCLWLQPCGSGPVARDLWLGGGAQADRVPCAEPRQGPGTGTFTVEVPRH